MNQNPNENLNPTNPNQMPNQGAAQVNNVSQFIKETPKTEPVKKKKKGLSRELVTIIGVLAIVAIL